MANGLLVIAALMSFFRVPNQVVVILTSILVMVLIVVPVFIVSHSRLYSTKKLIDFLVFISFFLFIISFFFSLQHFFFLPSLPLRIVAVISGIVVLCYFFIEVRKGRIKFFQTAFVKHFILFIVLLLACSPIQLQQEDAFFDPHILAPVYDTNQGPIIFIDEGHCNFHTLDGGLFATGNLLAKDGYRVLPHNGSSTLQQLKECSIYIIVNALNEKNDDWANPIYSAFTDQEIKEITQWVSAGGSLLLIADHMPFPGAIANLASQFGFEFESGHAESATGSPDYFCRSANSLCDNAITNGRNKGEKVDSILTFSGSSFRAPEDAIPILKLDSTWVTYNTDVAWEFHGTDPVSISGNVQGAYKKHGKGRVVVFGEAAMYTAQLGAGLSWIKIGMNAPVCPNNYQLLLNSIHWLDGVLN